MESTTTRENTVSEKDQEGMYSMMKIYEVMYFASMMPDKREDKDQEEHTPLANPCEFHYRRECLKCNWR